MTNPDCEAQRTTGDGTEVRSADREAGGRERLEGWLLDMIHEARQDDPGAGLRGVTTDEGLANVLATGIMDTRDDFANLLRTEPGVSVVNVVAAVRMDGTGRYWVCRRTDDGSHGGLAGMWEYPGGKVEDGESLREALVREMDEEFGVAITVGRKLDRILAQHDESGPVYAVHFFETRFEDTPELRVHDLWAWLTPEQLAEYKHLPSGTVFNRLLLARMEPGGEREEVRNARHEAARIVRRNEGIEGYCPVEVPLDVLRSLVTHRSSSQRARERRPVS